MVALICVMRLCKIFLSSNPNPHSSIRLLVALNCELCVRDVQFLQYNSTQEWTVKDCVQQKGRDHREFKIIVYQLTINTNATHINVSTTILFSITFYILNRLNGLREKWENVHTMFRSDLHIFIKRAKRLLPHLILSS